MRAFRRRDYLNISACAFALSYFSNSIHLLILPMLLLALASPERKGTYLATIKSLGLVLAVVVQPLAGHLSDRSTSHWGRRRPFILAGALLYLGALIGLGLSTNILRLFLSYIGLQLAGNIILGPFQGFIPDLVPEGRRGLASGVKNLAEIAGGMTSWLVVAPLMDRSWLGPAVASLVLVLALTTIITLAGVREAPWPQEARPSWRGLGELGRYPEFAWLMASRFFTILALSSIQTFSLFFLRDVVGISSFAPLSRSLMPVLALSVVLAAYLTGQLSDRAGRKPFLFLAGILGALASILLLAAHDARGILLYAIPLGLATGAFLSSGWALATDLVPGRQAGLFLGLTNLSTAGSAALAGVGGPLIDLFNALRPRLGYTMLLLTVCLYFLIGAALVMKVREPQHRTTP